MSDIASLEWKLSIETISLAYAARKLTRIALFAVEIPYPLLKAWYDFLKNSSLNQGASKSANCADQSANSCHKYTDLQEFSIPENFFSISDGPVVREEIHQSLRKPAGDVKGKYTKTQKGRKSEALKSKSKRFHILEGQTISDMEVWNEFSHVQR